MPTKLKKPITITITHVENAVATLMKSQLRPSHSNFDAINGRCAEAEIFNQIDTGLLDQGIDWRTWIPEPPFKISGHEITFNDDGSAQIGCTKVTAKEIEEFNKRRLQVEWPKYYRSKSSGTVYRAMSPMDDGKYFASGRWFQSCPGACEQHHNEHPAEFPCITRAEAAAIVGEENL